MATNAFVGKLKPPTDTELSAELGDQKSLWEELLDRLDSLGITDREWSSYSPKAGWALKVLRRGRVIVYLSPMRGGFRASFALGEKAMSMAKKTKFSPKILTIIAEARRYAEGTAVRIDVRSRVDVSAVEKLAAIKLAN